MSDYTEDWHGWEAREEAESRTRGEAMSTGPDYVIWPQYCLGHIPCDHQGSHGSHFWMHYSGYPAVCEGKP